MWCTRRHGTLTFNAIITHVPAVVHRGSRARFIERQWTVPAGVGLLLAVTDAATAARWASIGLSLPRHRRRARLHSYGCSPARRARRRWPPAQDANLPGAGRSSGFPSAGAVAWSRWIRGAQSGMREGRIPAGRLCSLAGGRRGAQGHAMYSLLRSDPKGGPRDMAVSRGKRPAMKTGDRRTDEEGVCAVAAGEVAQCGSKQGSGEAHEEQQTEQRACWFILEGEVGGEIRGSLLEVSLVSVSLDGGSMRALMTEIVCLERSGALNLITTIINDEAHTDGAVLRIAVGIRRRGKEGGSKRPTTNSGSGAAAADSRDVMEVVVLRASKPTSMPAAAASLPTGNKARRQPRMDASFTALTYSSSRGTQRRPAPRR